MEQVAAVVPAELAELAARIPEPEEPQAQAELAEPVVPEEPVGRVAQEEPEAQVVPLAQAVQAAPALEEPEVQAARGGQAELIRLGRPPRPLPHW